MVRQSLVRLVAAVPCGAVALSLPLLLASAPPAQAKGCQAPMLGRYAVMGMGTVGNPSATTPEARLLEERWLTGGAVEGRTVERIGRQVRTASYKGTVRMVGTCLVRVERQLPWGQQVSEAVVDGRGRPLYSLDRTPGTVISSRWLPMAPGSCKPGDLNGVVLSSQVGLNWQAPRGGWSPNAVIQREQWSDGSVRGIALSSYGGVGATASYSGALKLDPDSCWGDLKEQDSTGTRFSYRTLVVNGRSGARGYLYLQNDPDNLTVGWLVRD